jgi:ferritin-like protein
MGRKYVENPPGSRFHYDIVDTPDTDEEIAEFRKARTQYGWVPENPTEEEQALIEQVQAEECASACIKKSVLA